MENGRSPVPVTSCVTRRTAVVAPPPVHSARRGPPARDVPETELALCGGDGDDDTAAPVRVLAASRRSSPLTAKRDRFHCQTAAKNAEFLSPLQNYCTSVCHVLRVQFYNK